MNMKPAYAVTLILTLTSCVFYADPGNSSAKLYPPIVERHWKTQEYPVDGGDQICVVTSGHNAIEIIMKKRAGQSSLEEIVHSTRNVSPGSQFNLRVGKNNYRTAGDYFPPETSRKIISDLLSGDNVYFEWQEPRSQLRGKQHIFYNMAPLKPFKKQYEKCRRFLGAPL